MKELITTIMQRKAISDFRWTTVDEMVRKGGVLKQVSVDEYRLQAAQDGVQIDLLLKDRKGPVLQGDRGYSQKGPEEGNASYYVSQTRLETTGSVRVDDQEYGVSGTSWSDHEFSTSALGPNQVGWDWFSIQLDDGSELMVYTIRRADGSVDDFSKGTLIYPDGSTRALTKDDFQVQVEDTWSSPHSDGVYPSAWTVLVPSEGLALLIRPHMADQELNLSFVYWEGAVKVEGEKNGVAVSGNGYVELTGYAQSLAGRF
jgi:predicted secreted hydrolase